MDASLLKIDQKTIDEIDGYIARSERTALSYVEIFRAFESVLLPSGVTNHYMLHGVLKYFSEQSETKKGYTLRKDYVTKDINVSRNDELVLFIKNNSPVHSSVIYQNFPELSSAVFSQILKRTGEIQCIGGRYYAHSSYLESKDKAERIGIHTGRGDMRTLDEVIMACEHCIDNNMDCRECPYADENGETGCTDIRTKDVLHYLKTLRELNPARKTAARSGRCAGA